MPEMTQGKHSIYNTAPPVTGDFETRDALAWAAEQANRIRAVEIRDGADDEAREMSHDTITV